MDNTVFPEAKILDLVISFAVGNSPKDRYYSEAPYDYLKKARGLTLVSKEFYNSVFRNHPDFVICKAHSELVSLLNKAPQLKKIKLTVCATSVGSDMQLFQKNLLFIKKEWKRLSDVLPNLELLDLTPTFHGIDMSPEDIVKKVGKSSRLGAKDVESDYILESQSIPFLRKTKYRLDRFGDAPEGLKLKCFQLGPPQKLGNIHTIHFKQQGDGQIDLFRPLKSTTLKRVEVDAFYSDEMDGFLCSNFTNALLKDLPPTLAELSLKDAFSFKVPCAFPSLRWLLLQGAYFTRNNLSHCLPEGLLYLDIDVGPFNVESGHEDGYHGFEFKTFDCTGLPSTLTKLAFHAWRGSENQGEDVQPMELVGALPLSLKELEVSEKEDVVFLPSNLPEGCTVSRVSRHR